MQSKSNSDINQEQIELLEYAQKRMNYFKKNALKLLKDFPQNDSNNSVKILLDYIIERKY